MLSQATANARLTSATRSRARGERGQQAHRRAFRPSAALAPRSLRPGTRGAGGVHLHPGCHQSERRRAQCPIVW